MNIDTINEQISKTPALMLYFSGISCGVCHDLKPKLHGAIEQNYPKIKWIEISVDSHKEIAAYFGVFALPTVIVFFDGKEFFKKSRNLSVNGFVDELKRPYQLFFKG